MPRQPRITLTDLEKDRLLIEQATMIERQAARIAELEAALGRPRKISSNSHLPPSKDGPGRENRPSRPAKPRPSRPGTSRPLSQTPDKTERCMAQQCRHCGKDVSSSPQNCRQRYDHIDLPVIRPIVTRVEIFGGRCGECGRRYRTEAPAAMRPGTPFRPGIRSLLMYLHHRHHVSFERLSRMLGELFGLSISEGAIAQAFSRMGADMAKASLVIKQMLVTARCPDDDAARRNQLKPLQKKDGILESHADSSRQAYA